MSTASSTTTSTRRTTKSTGTRTARPRSPQKTSAAMVSSNGDVVAQRAYEIWTAEGCPEGRDLENWLQAEQEMSAAKK